MIFLRLCILITLLCINIVKADSTIVALVGDEVISNKDLKDRYKFFLIENPQIKIKNIQQKQSLYRNILKSLIDEMILSHEMKKLNIKVSNQEIQNMITMIEKRQKIPRGTFDIYLKNKGISKDYAVSQIKKNIMWDKFISDVVSPKVQLSSQEIINFISKKYPDKLIVEYEVFKGEKEALQKIQHKISSCDQYKTSSRYKVEKFRESFSAIKGKQIQNKVFSTVENHPSNIFDENKKSTMIFVCEKIKPKDPSLHNSIMNNLMDTKVAVQAEYMIKNMAKNKYIEIFDIDEEL